MGKGHTSINIKVGNTSVHIQTCGVQLSNGIGRNKTRRTRGRGVPMGSSESDMESIVAKLARKLEERGSLLAVAQRDGQGTEPPLTW